MIRFIKLAMLLVCFGQAAQAGASTYDFTVSDGAGDSGYGTLTTVNSGLGDNSLLVVSGSLTFTSTSPGNGSPGTYTLITSPNSPNVFFSPSGLFEVDNLLYPNNQAANGVNPGISTNPSYLTNWGLLFGQPGTGSQTEVNIWGNGGGDYAIYSEVNGNLGGVTSGASFQLTAVPDPSAVPEPATMTLAAIGFVGLVCYRVRKRTLAAV